MSPRCSGIGANQNVRGKVTVNQNRLQYIFSLFSNYGKQEDLEQLLALQLLKKNRSA